MFIYSAFYDDRPFLNGKNALRVLVISTPITNRIYCQMWTKEPRESSQSFITEAQLLKSDAEIKFDENVYEQFILTCSLESRSMRPERLSLVWTDPCTEPENVIQIQYPESRGSRKPFHEFGLCAPIAFGYVDPYRIIEWVEMHRFLGVTEINVYYFYLSSETLTALKYYQKEGIVKVFKLPPLPGHQNEENGLKLSSFISLNDCMLRNLYLYKWILVTDFDEIILPANDRTETNFYQLMSTAKKALKGVKNIYPISYAFRHSYFWVSCRKHNLFRAKTYFFQYFEREEVSNFLYFPKSFTNPKLCLSLGNINCEIPYFMFASGQNKVGSDHWTYDVPQNIGLLHHYKEISDQENCESFAKDRKLTLDPSASKFELYIQAQVQKAVQLLSLT